MVISKIEGVLFHKPMIPALKAGIAAVKTIGKLKPGKYRFDGGYFSIQKGETELTNEGTFEARRRYIDVQIPAKGCEEVVQADVGDLKTVIPYGRKENAERLSGDTGNRVRVDRGIFYVAFPHDGHRPVFHADEPHPFTEVTVKIPVSERVQAYSGG